MSDGKEEEERIEAGPFYSTFHGHSPKYLASILRQLRRKRPEHSILFLAGDSSVDNKHWLFPFYEQSSYRLLSDQEAGVFSADAVNGYEEILSPPKMVKDVTFYLNKFAEEEDAECITLNTSVEATTLTSRVGGCQMCCCPSLGGLYPQDELIKEHITENDYLVISIGGNDIALAPSIFTIIFMVLLMLCPWFLVNQLNPICWYFMWLFRCKVQMYAKDLTSVRKPRKVGVCLIYNLDQANGTSWANAALFCLCYFWSPAMLQYRMKVIYNIATSGINVAGTEVVPIALSEALDGSQTDDYHERVEPSSRGSAKIAALILNRLGLLSDNAAPMDLLPTSSSVHDYSIFKPCTGDLIVTGIITAIIILSIFVP